MFLSYLDISSKTEANLSRLLVRSNYLWIYKIQTGVDILLISFSQVCILAAVRSHLKTKYFK
jgi:hypothetical protein